MKNLSLFYLTLLSVNIAYASSLNEDQAYLPLPEPTIATATKNPNFEWRRERARRQRAINAYYKANPDGAKAFLIEPNGTGPVPVIMFRLFSELFPEIWGTSREHYKPIGLSRNTFVRHSVLPLGMGYSPAEEELSAPNAPVTLNKAGFNCISCHAGQVQVSNSKTIPLVGAPNTRMNYPLFLIAQTLQSPNFTADHFRKALANKPLGWIYKDPKMLRTEIRERQIFNRPGVAENLIANIQATVTPMMGAFNFLKEFAYKENAPDPLATKRGSLDVLVTTYMSFLSWAKVNKPEVFDPKIIKTVIPVQAAEIDSPSIWNQKGRGRGHWDATTGNPLHRNIGAAASVLNKPVNIENVHKITAFTDHLPSNPYPFDVDMKKARRGEKLFQNHCLSCHGAQNQLYDIASVGTDANRLNHFTPTAAGFLGGLLLSLCPDDRYCKKADGSSYTPPELGIKTNGYVGGRLDGVWARAPYLHNGSVPTLYALLTNDRPETFYRGAITYDQEKVGFTWDQAAKGTVEYNTQLDGNSNRGHNTEEYLGLDWASHPAELSDLLEFMKTL